MKLFRDFALGAVTAAALVGCASTQAVLSGSPDEVVRSQKSQVEVAFCLANANNVPSIEAPDGARIIRITNAVGAVGVIFSVYAEGSGSRIEIRKPVSVSIATHRRCY